MTEDISLKIIRTTIFSIVVPHKEPCTTYKIKMEYRDMEGEDIPYSEYGHRNLDDFLLSHPMLNGMMHEGKWVFTAKISERSANIQALVKGQKGKKRKAKKGNNPFARNSIRSSYHGNTLGHGDVRRPNGSQPFNRNQSTYKSFTTGTYRPTTNVFSNPKISFVGSQPSRPGSSFGSYNAQATSNASSTFRPPQLAGNRKFTPTLAPSRPSNVAYPAPISRIDGPQEGMRRFNAILFKCKGAATLRVFCRLYAQEFHVPFNADELKRHFNTFNLAEVINKHGNDKILVSSIDGDVMFTDSQVYEAHTKADKELEERKKNMVVIEPERKHCSIPSLPKLFDEMTDMLVDSFPHGIPIGELTSRYEERTEVKVDPLVVFALSWTELIENKFKSRIRIDNGKAVLTPVYIKANNIHVRGERKKQELVTLSNLGIVYMDESSQEEEDEDEEECSETASSASAEVNTSKTTWRAPPSGYESMCSSVASSVNCLNTSPRETTDSVISEELDELAEKMRRVKVKVDQDSPRLEVTIVQSSPPKTSESIARRNLMLRLDGTEEPNVTVKKENEKDEKSTKKSFFSKFGLSFGASRSTSAQASTTAQSTISSTVSSPRVVMNPSERLTMAASGEYKSFSILVVSKEVYAYKVTCKSPYYRIIGGTGFTNGSAPKIMQVMREFGPKGDTLISIAFVKKGSGETRLPAHIMEDTTPHFTIEYLFTAH